MSYTEIAYDVDDHVATITLDRPDRLNAFTVTMQRELCRVLDEIDADPEVRAVVVTGRGAGSARAPTSAAEAPPSTTTATSPRREAWCVRATAATGTRAGSSPSGSSSAPSR